MGFLMGLGIGLLLAWYFGKEWVNDMTSMAADDGWLEGFEHAMEELGIKEEGPAR